MIGSQKPRLLLVFPKMECSAYADQSIMANIQANNVCVSFCTITMIRTQRNGVGALRTINKEWSDMSDLQISVLIY